MNIKEIRKQLHESNVDLIQVMDFVNSYEPNYYRFKVKYPTKQFLIRLRNENANEYEKVAQAILNSELGTEKAYTGYVTPKRIESMSEDKYRKSLEINKFALIDATMNIIRREHEDKNGMVRISEDIKRWFKWYKKGFK